MHMCDIREKEEEVIKNWIAESRLIYVKALRDVFDIRFFEIASNIRIKYTVT